MKLEINAESPAYIGSVTERHLHAVHPRWESSKIHSIPSSETQAAVPP